MDQPDFSSRARPPRRYADRLLLVSGLLALLASGFLSLTTRRQAGDAVAHVVEVRREVAQQNARLRALGGGSDAEPDNSPERIVAALAAVLPRDVRLSQLTIDYGRGVALTMRVHARSPAAWDRLLDGLGRSPDFTDVMSGPETRESPLTGRVRARWSRGAR